MAKISDDQKALNKEAKKLRDKEYKQRKSAYWQESEEASKAVDASDIARNAREAYDALNLAIEAKRAALDEIEEQIKALKLKAAEVQNEHESTIAVLLTNKNAAWETLKKAKDAAKSRVEEKYPDVAHCWGAAGWKSIEEFIHLVPLKDKSCQ